MTTRTMLGALLAALALSFGPNPASAQDDTRSFQGNDLFGRPMYTVGSNPVNVAATPVNV